MAILCDTLRPPNPEAAVHKGNWLCALPETGLVGEPSRYCPCQPIADLGHSLTSSLAGALVCEIHVCGTTAAFLLMGMSMLVAADITSVAEFVALRSTAHEVPFVPLEEAFHDRPEVVPHTP
ncbi:hypothetical protein BKA82DRAFT_22278 [Pisolithus tinctorius]|uniref:Uncharacterized protein n=1 Tax=Pisolithus tinctorius Marx 270 TaxID=870435 RepID=A0A0C3PLA9_PISTI|nr:hypothetical protein BKA82DRAFT_22278 [Pisolithus tinctorius]KIO09069.1 hypothetical protein M404DRAFT_22278 [Pisolithus tinctorius Marx 270]